MSAGPRALVLNAPGINCNLETGFALEQAGAMADQVHISQLTSGEVSLDHYQMLMLSGGFSYGDDIASGRILGLELRKNLPDELNRFVEAGKAVVGICNGFQALVESGLLPDGRIDEHREKVTTLVTNKNKKFEDRWSRMVVAPSVSQLIPERLEEQVVELPVAHGEGRFVHNDQNYDLFNWGQVVLQYSDIEGNPTEDYPANPNGSPRGVAAICSVHEGTVLGMMPHPERYVTTTQHPNWRRGEGTQPFGALLMQGFVNYAKGL